MWWHEKSCSSHSCSSKARFAEDGEDVSSFADETLYSMLRARLLELRRFNPKVVV